MFVGVGLLTGIEAPGGFEQPTDFFSPARRCVEMSGDVIGVLFNKLPNECRAFNASGGGSDGPPLSLPTSRSFVCLRRQKVLVIAPARKLDHCSFASIKCRLSERCRYYISKKVA